MAKITKLVMITCTAFLERQNPVSTMAKPACMKKTSAPPKITKKRLSEVLTWPSSAAISAPVGSPTTSAVTSAAAPVADPDGSPAQAKPPKRNVESSASSSAPASALLNEGRDQRPRGWSGGGAAHSVRADPGRELIIVVILCSHGFVVRVVCVVGECGAASCSFRVACRRLKRKKLPRPLRPGELLRSPPGTSACRDATI